mgnify:CR=1 FL=1
MDEKKQKLLIEYLLSSPDTFALCQNIVDPEYFDPEFRESVRFMKQYYEDYSTTPSNNQVLAETNNEFVHRDVAPDEIEYCSHEVEKFCKRKGIEKAILASPQLIEDGDYGTVEQIIKDAVTISLNKNLGLNYFETVDERLEMMMNQSPTISTGWKEVDALLFGGLSRKELLLVSANSGGGKSITLANLGFNYVAQGYNVLYISLELSPEIVAQRYDTMYTGIGRQVWRDEISTLTTRLKMEGEKEGIGRLDITQMPTGTTANDIRAYLKEFYLHNNFMPDMLILDYLDEMAPNEFVSADNVFEKDRRCTTQLRQIGVDEDMIVATASQLNRSAVGATHHDHSQIAGGISKINVSDVYWSIIMTEAQKAAGEMIFHFQKTRNSDGVGKTLYMKWDGKYLRILDGDGSSPPDGITFNKKKETGPKDRLMKEVFGQEDETPLGLSLIHI